MANQLFLVINNTAMLPTGMAPADSTTAAADTALAATGAFEAGSDVTDNVESNSLTDWMLNKVTVSATEPARIHFDIELTDELLPTLWGRAQSNLVHFLFYQSPPDEGGVPPRLPTPIYDDGDATTPLLFGWGGEIVSVTPSSTLVGAATNAGRVQLQVDYNSLTWGTRN